jgi:glycosyltransferase involved in cell wall biosynthesis
MATSVRNRVRSVHFVVPGPLETRTGGYEYDRRIIAGLRGLGWRVTVIEAQGAFPFPSADSLAALRDTLAGVPDAAVVVADGLAMGAAPDQVIEAAGRLRFVALVHHPLARETGLNEARMAALETSERRALAAARAVVVTSRATVASLEPYGVPRSHVTAVEPGTDPAPIARGSTDGSVHLLTVGSLVPRKGYVVLADALGSIAGRAWRLTSVGSLDRDPPTVDRFRARLRLHGIEARVELAGEADAAALGRHYDAADLFVLPTLHEGYGMAVAEAIARGLPVISTPTGGIPALVGDAAGLLVPVGDSVALAQALSRVILDADERSRLAAGARRARAHLPSWDAATAAFAAVIEGIAGA